MINATPPWIVKPLVAEEVYTDRAEFLEYFYRDALCAATRRSMSTVLLGRRRMGKTEIFKRVVNRLFFEQDPTSPQAVVPVYYSFQDKKQDRWDFAKDYLENFIRHYLAFYARQPEIITQIWPTESLLPLLQSAKATHPYPDSLDTILRWDDATLRQQITLPEQQAIETPRRISDLYDSTIVVFLDEFQNTRLPHYEFDVVGLMAPVLAEHCGDNPFYINAVIRQAAKLPQPLVDEEAINTVLAVDLSSGFIWAELYEQVSGWIERINEYGITKWILYLSAQEEEDRINLERIQQALEPEGKSVPLDKIRDVLVRLSRGDLLEYLELGRWFRKTDDPILLEFLKVWGRIEVEGQNAKDVQDDLVARYQHLERRIWEYLLGAIGTEKWVCQSKWLTTKKVGVNVLHALLEQAAAVQAEFTRNTVRIWLFAHEGLTKEAEKLAQEQSILWSNRAQLDDLLTYLGLRKLPTVPTTA